MDARQIVGVSDAATWISERMLARGSNSGSVREE